MIWSILQGMAGGIASGIVIVLWLARVGRATTRTEQRKETP